MEYTTIIISILGGIVGFLIVSLISKRNKTPLDTTDSNELRDEMLSLRKDKEHLESRLENAKEEFKAQQNRERELTDERVKLSSELSSTKTELQKMGEKLAEEESRLAELQERFTKEFKLVANSILKENTKDFSATHQKELEDILKPLKEKIKTFEESVEKKYNHENTERITLKNELKHLLELNQTLNTQAQNLTNALKGESKTRGNWGELVLERILESSGLIEGEEYQTQYSDTNNENKRIQPDVIINLPDDKHLIIDSKVSLVAYDNYMAEEDDIERAKQLKLHVMSVRNHVNQLSDKNYQSGKKLNSPDFVLLFMPIEPAFSLAVQNDPQLYVHAWDKKVVIVSPTTLLATLRTIASVWKNEKFTRNVKEIQEKAGLLYDKFVGFLDDMQKIDRGLISARSAYDDAHNKLRSGRGNIVGRIEKIKELGASSQKEIPAEFKQEED